MQQDSFERITRHIQKRDLERLMKQLSPLAKLPGHVRVVEATAKVMEDWTNRGLKGSDISVVWGHLRETFAPQRTLNDQWDHASGLVDRVGLHHGNPARPVYLMATDYFKLKANIEALGAMPR